MLQAQIDSIVLRFVLDNYDDIQQECAAAKKLTQFKVGNRLPANSALAVLKHNKRDSRKKNNNTFCGRCVARLGCSPQKVIDAKKLVDAVRQLKISQNVVAAVLAGQLTIREALYSGGSVYVLSDGCLIKIGCTKSDVGSRLKRLAKELRNNTKINVRNLKLLATAVVADPHRVEKELHARFAVKRRVGEWFELSAADINELMQMLRTM